MSSIGNPIVLSGYIVLCIPLVLYIRKTQKNKLLWNFITLIHIVCILFTFSRSTIAILGVVCIFFILKTEKINSIIKSLFLVLFISLLFYFILDSYGLSQSLIDRLLFRTGSASFDIRNQAYDIAFNVWSHSNLLFGLGKVSFGDYLVNTLSFNNGTLENVFLTLLVGTGLGGLISFLFILLALFRSFSKMEYSLKVTGYSILIVFILLSTFISALPYDCLWGVFWYFTGLILLHTKKLTPSNEV